MKYFLFALQQITRPLFVTLGCLLSYALIITLAAGVVVFVGFGIFSVWSLFINLLFGKP